MACKPSAAHLGKCLKNGAGCRSRTRDLMITKHPVFLKSLGNFAENRVSRRYLSSAVRSPVNRKDV